MECPVCNEPGAENITVKTGQFETFRCARCGEYDVSDSAELTRHDPRQMTQQQQIIAQILTAEPWKRGDILDAIEREYGRGFRKTVQEIVQPRQPRNEAR